MRIGEERREEERKGEERRKLMAREAETGYD